MAHPRATVWRNVRSSTDQETEAVTVGSTIHERHAKLDPTIRGLLAELDLPEICWTAFEAEGIDIESLAALNDGNLQAMGVTRMGDRKKLVQRARALLASREAHHDVALVNNIISDDALEADTPPSDLAAQCAITHPDREMNKRQLDESGKPRDGWGEWEEDNGLYRGEWVDGKPHGKGMYVWRSGVRYDGEWYAGKPHGRGEWTYNRAGGGTGGRDKVWLERFKYKNLGQTSSQEAEASAYDIGMHPEGLPASMDVQTASKGSARATRFKAIKSDADLERLSRGAHLWWPADPKEGDVTWTQNNALAKDFCERVLRPDSQVSAWFICVRVYYACMYVLAVVCRVCVCL
jgi:hypothetical protein